MPTRRRPSAAEPELPEPSALFATRAKDLERAARLGPVVDLASGRGRHAIPAAERGLRVIAVDRDPDFLRALGESASARGVAVARVRVDLESGRGLPFRPASCGAILVFRFLHRPLAPAIETALAPGGLLLYETFTTDQRALGSGPRRPAFLLERGELPALFPGLEVLSYDEGIRARGTEATARLAARKPPGR